MTHRPGKPLRLPAAKLSLVLFVSQYLDRGLITENIIEAHVILEFQVIVIAQNYCSYARYQYFGTRITVRFFYSGLYHAEAVISIDFSGRDFHVSRTVHTHSLLGARRTSRSSKTTSLQPIPDLPSTLIKQRRSSCCQIQILRY